MSSTSFNGDLVMTLSSDSQAGMTLLSRIKQRLKSAYQHGRQCLLTRRLASAGSHLQLDGGIRFEYPERIDLLARVRLGRHALLRANSGGRITLGADVSVLEDTMLTANGGTIDVGERSWLGAGTYLYGNGDIHIGADVLIAARTIINTVSHHYGDISTPINAQGIHTAPVTIEDDVWIGLNCQILQGVTIHTGAIIGAGSLVNTDIPAYSIAVGTPARVIGMRPGPEQASSTGVAA